MGTATIVPFPRRRRAQPTEPAPQKQTIDLPPSVYDAYVWLMQAFWIREERKSLSEALAKRFRVSLDVASARIKTARRAGLVTSTGKPGRGAEIIPIPAVVHGCFHEGEVVAWQEKLATMSLDPEVRAKIDRVKGKIVRKYDGRATNGRADALTRETTVLERAYVEAYNAYQSHRTYTSSQRSRSLFRACVDDLRKRGVKPSEFRLFVEDAVKWWTENRGFFPTPQCLATEQGVQKFADSLGKPCPDYRPVVAILDQRGHPRSWAQELAFYYELSRKQDVDLTGFSSRSIRRAFTDVCEALAGQPLPTWHSALAEKQWKADVETFQAEDAALLTAATANDRHQRDEDMMLTRIREDALKEAASHPDVADAREKMLGCLSRRDQDGMKHWAQQRRDRQDRLYQAAYLRLVAEHRKRGLLRAA